jgi:hypothetical protein
LTNESSLSGFFGGPLSKYKSSSFGKEEREKTKNSRQR